MLTGKELGAAISKALDIKGRGAAKALADALGIRPPSINDMKNFGRIDKKHLPALYKFFSDVVGPEHWGIQQYPWIEVSPNKDAGLIDIDQHPEYAAIKRVKFKLSAGISGYEIEYLNGQRAPIFFRQDWLDLRNLSASKMMAVEVCGQSMEPSLFDGDIVVVNIGDITPTDGDVFAVNYDGEMVIKRLMKDAGEWFLSSDNSDKRRFPNKLCDERTSIIGRIVHKQSERI